MVVRSARRLTSKAVGWSLLVRAITFSSILLLELGAVTALGATLNSVNLAALGGVLAVCALSLAMGGSMARGRESRAAYVVAIDVLWLAGSAGILASAPDSYMAAACVVVILLSIASLSANAVSHRSERR